MTPLFKNAPKFPHFITWIKWFFRQCKYTIQRARRGYCDADTWNMCDEIIPTLRDMLIQFKKEHNGVPNQYFEQTLDVDEADVLWCAKLEELIQLANEISVDELDLPSYTIFKRYLELQKDALMPEHEIEKVRQDWISARHAEIIAKQENTVKFFTEFAEIYSYLWW